MTLDYNCQKFIGHLALVLIELWHWDSTYSLPTIFTASIEVNRFDYTHKEVKKFVSLVQVVISWSSP